MKWGRRFAVLASSMAGLALVASCAWAQAPWVRHTVDAAGQGADGVRLADANGDGRPDVVTPWEEGGLVRVYLHPGPDAVRAPWPAVTVGAVASPEDAVLVDLDADGALDVVSACEGQTRSLFVHWAPSDPARYLDADAWRTEAVPAAAGRMAWMFVAPVPNAHGGVDLVVAGKNEDAAVGRLRVPADARDVAAWRWQPLGPAGWVMTLLPADVDADGDLDVLLTDRRGPRRGLRWLEQPADAAAPWPEHAVGGDAHEVMFMAVGDLDGDGRQDLVSATLGDSLLLFRRRPGPGVAWTREALAVPPGTGQPKGVAVGDLDGDGRQDLVFSCEHAHERAGVVALLSRAGGGWTPYDVGGPEGTKFDLVQLVDLDEDGDLDVLTCEEREGLGVVWYENPLGGPGR